MNKNGKKWRVFSKENRLQNYFWWVFGHVWTGFCMLFNFPPTLSKNCIFFRQKSLIDFWPFFSPFSLPGLLPQAIPTPWKCFLRVPWLKTFHLGPRKPPKPLLAKKIPHLPILNYTPSPLCIVMFETIFQKGISIGKSPKCKMCQIAIKYILTFKILWSRCIAIGQKWLFYSQNLPLAAV